MQPSTHAKRLTLRRAPGSTSSGTEVTRRLWLKTPNVEYSANATKKPSVRALVPKRPRYSTAWIPDAAAIANVASDIAIPARALRVSLGRLMASSLSDTPGVSPPSVSVCVLMSEKRAGGDVSRVAG
jgi:hypothetical protein